MSSVETTATLWPCRPLPWRAIGAGLAALGLVGWLAAAFGGDPDGAWSALLVSFLYFTPLAAGAVVWSAVVTVVRGGWARSAERAAMAGVAFGPVSVIAFVVLWFGGRGGWAHWLREGHLHNGAWLGGDLVFVRVFVALLAFWGLAAFFVRRRLQGHGRVVGAWLILVYAIVFSVIGFDLVMALDPHWYSSLFGGYFFISGLYTAAAAWALGACWRGVDVGTRHDLGKLVFAFSMLTTYMMFSQLLPIWYANLPHEVRFIIPRMNMAEWGPVSAGLLLTCYLGPLVLLLGRGAKRSRRYLAAISMLLLVALWVERWWLVVPTLEGPLTPGLADLAAVALCGGLLAVSLDAFERQVPPAPVPEPSHGD